MGKAPSINPDFSCDLEPCPCCGGEAEIRRTICDRTIFWYVRCKKCGIRTLDFEETHSDCILYMSSLPDATNAMRETIGYAVATWNKRIPYVPRTSITPNSFKLDVSPLAQSISKFNDTASNAFESLAKALNGAPCKATVADTSKSKKNKHKKKKHKKGD